MATTKTIPQTTFPIGRVSVRLNVPGNVSRYLLTLNEIGWPYTGGLAFSYVCNVSLDGGTTWVDPPPSGGSNEDLPTPARRGFPANQIRIACDIPGAGNGNRVIEFQADFAKVLTVSGTLQAS